MEPIFNNFPREFDSLDPMIRPRALAKVKELMLEGSIAESEAIAQAMEIAQEWFYEIEDEV